MVFNDLLEYCALDDKKLFAWIDRNVIYSDTFDDFDIRREARRCLTEKLGDCLSVASLVCDVMRAWGREAYILSMIPAQQSDENPAHAICIYRTADDNYWYASFSHENYIENKMVGKWTKEYTALAHEQIAKTFIPDVKMLKVYRYDS